MATSNSDIEAPTAADSAWEAEQKRRGCPPLVPAKIEDLSIVVPGNSGDVALCTSVVRFVKRRNPSCKVSFITIRQNAALIQLCPGVDRVVVMPSQDYLSQSRKRLLVEFSAERGTVISTVNWSDDYDLLGTYNLHESIWLLAGLSRADYLRSAGDRLWLDPPVRSEPLAFRPDAFRDAKPAFLPAMVKRYLVTRMRTPDVTERAVGAGAVDATPAKATDNVRSATPPGAKWRLRRRLLSLGNKILRNVPALARVDLVAPLLKMFCMPDRNGQVRTFDRAPYKHVILSDDSQSQGRLHPVVVTLLVAVLRQGGWRVLHNVRDPALAFPGTTPLICSYPEFVALRAAGHPFVGWRSGLCDVAACSRAPMVVLYPAKTQVNRPVIELFGFRRMGFGDFCLDVLCDKLRTMPFRHILQHIEGKQES